MLVDVEKNDEKWNQSAVLQKPGPASNMAVFQFIINTENLIYVT